MSEQDKDGSALQPIVESDTAATLDQEEPYYDEPAKFDRILNYIGTKKRRCNDGAF